MLPDKHWSLEAIGRLMVGIFACLLLGQVALLATRFHPATATLSPAWFYLEISTAGIALLGALATLRKPWTATAFRARGITLLICCYSALALINLAQRGSGSTGHPPTVLTMVVTAVSFQGAAIGLIWFLVRQQGWRWPEAFGFRVAPRHAILLGLTVAFASLPVGFGLNFALSVIAERLNFHLPAQDAVLIVRLAESWPDRIALAIVTVVLAPLAEEALFRGIAFPTLRRYSSARLAMWGSSLAFAIIHFNALTFIPLLLLSVALTWLYQRTGNLLASIACHAMFNAINFVLLFLTDIDRLQTQTPS